MVLRGSHGALRREDILARGAPLQGPRGLEMPGTFREQKRGSCGPELRAVGGEATDARPGLTSTGRCFPVTVGPVGNKGVGKF